MKAHAEKVALVTGAYRGIGLEVSRRLAQLGFAVVLTARDPRKAEEAAAALKGAGPDVAPFPLDVTDRQSVEAARLFVEGRFGRLDVLVNNAAVLVNSVCPGWVATEMGGPDAPRTIEEGAAGVVWAATLPDGGPTGGFFRDGRPLPW